MLFKRQTDAIAAIECAHQLLARVEAHLTVPNARGFLTGAAPTIADVACYAYLAHAPEGNVSLEAYPAVRAWLARVEALPGFIPMTATVRGADA